MAWITVFVGISTFTLFVGRGGGQMVRMLSFYSDGPSSNPADVYSSYSVILFQNNKKETGDGPFKKLCMSCHKRLRTSFDINRAFNTPCTCNLVSAKNSMWFWNRKDENIKNCCLSMPLMSSMLGWLTQAACGCGRMLQFGKLENSQVFALQHSAEASNIICSLCECAFITYLCR